jgi:hypothetical protein
MNPNMSLRVRLGFTETVKGRDLPTDGEKKTRDEEITESTITHFASRERKRAEAETKNKSTGAGSEKGMKYANNGQEKTSYANNRNKRKSAYSKREMKQLGPIATRDPRPGFVEIMYPSPYVTPLTNLTLRQDEVLYLNKLHPTKRCAELNTHSPADYDRCVTERWRAKLVENKETNTMELMLGDNTLGYYALSA